jgi:hypothetical protein
MTIPMPEPVAWITNESLYGLKAGRTNSKGAVPVHASRSYVAKTPLITTTQAEAYAAAKVRAAMKSLLHTMNGHGRAARERFGESGKPYDEGRRTAYEQAAAEVRALIPPLPGPVEPTT